MPKTNARLVRIHAALCLALLVLVVLAAAGTLDVRVELALAVPIAITAVALVIARPRETEGELGDYRLGEPLDKGSMGEVWRATHASLVRPVAIKLIRHELSASMTRQEREAMHQRFRREVKITATLSSPHTIEVLDFGERPDGSLYYVMELLHGLTAEALVAKFGPQPAERVVHLISQACASLAEAHHRKLIHRDIKPANLYLCAIGLEVDFVKVLDFGLARDLTSDTRLTREGSTPGTPAYLAPEQIRDRTDHRSDLYSLGCVAYFLLTGRLVFEASSTVAMMTAHAREAPVAPSKRTELPIPPELDELVLALLAKDPAERPRSATELARRLGAIPLATPWTSERAETWWRTHLPELVRGARDGG